MHLVRAPGVHAGGHYGFCLYQAALNRLDNPYGQRFSIEAITVAASNSVVGSTHPCHSCAARTHVRWFDGLAANDCRRAAKSGTWCLTIRSNPLPQPTAAVNRIPRGWVNSLRVACPNTI